MSTKLESKFLRGIMLELILNVLSRLLIGIILFVVLSIHKISSYLFKVPYQKKSGNSPKHTDSTLNDDGTLTIQMKDEKGNLLNIYVIDPNWNRYERKRSKSS